MSKEQQRTLQYRVYEGSDLLGKDDRRLFEEARKALLSSYSPYSGFPVGAALLLDDGSIVQASNQENAAYPSSICAERVAAWKAASERPDREFVALALTVERKSHTKPVSPCGGCRQVLSEYEERSSNPIRVLFPGGDGRIIEVERVRDLLPFPFEPASLIEDQGGP